MSRKGYLRNGRISVSVRTWEKDAWNISCSVVMFGSPVSSLSRSARLRSKTGAKVSGMVMQKIVTTPAKIMFTWLNHDERFYFPDTETKLTQRIHLHPMVSPTNPPTIGPRTGPPQGAAANNAIANPRSLLSQISEMVPPASVKGAEANRPQKKRQIKSVWMFFATAHGMLKTRNLLDPANYPEIIMDTHQRRSDWE